MPELMKVLEQNATKCEMLTEITIRGKFFDVL